MGYPRTRVRSVVEFGFLACLAGCVAQVTGCGPEDVGVGCGALAGDLVISEIMPNPVDDDVGQEWLEVYNASTVDQVLDRVVIQRLTGTAGDPTVAADPSVRGAPGSLGPGEYLVLGDGSTRVAPVYYRYGAPLDNENIGALNDTAGGLRLVCKGSVIDEVWYGIGPAAIEPQEGRSIALDGGMPPDALQNDRAELWCAGVARYDGVNAGTPGGENTLCGLVACDEDGTSRDVVPPQAGDLVITEVLADPEGTGGSDWVELYVAATGTVDLNGLRIVAESPAGSERLAQVTSLECLTAQSGDYIVIAGTVDPSGGGLLTPDAVAPGLDVFATGGSVSLRRGAVVFDRVPLLRPEEGRSVALDDAVSLSPRANDDAADWCYGSGAYDAVNAGSPGAPNLGCSAAACLDRGVARPTVRPSVGDLLITELLADPDGPDAGGEWIEVLVTATAPVDLNGLIIDGVGTVMAMDASCITGQPGEYVTIAASGSALRAADIVAADLLLSAGAGAVELRRGNGAVDTATLPRSAPRRALALDLPATVGACNDDAAHWCYADELYDGVNSGSPGAANPTCGVSLCGVSVARPGPGDLLITEVFGNPSGIEENKEWIEILVTAAGPVDLDGIILSDSTSRLMALGSSCTAVQPGDYVVLGASSDTALNGNIDAAIEVAGLSLSSDVERIELYRGDVLVDAASLPRSIEGASLSLDPLRIAAADNDAPDAFCSSRTSGLFDEYGTPGAANETCTLGCKDGLQLRDPVSPSPGDLVITEALADPDGADGGRDWIELYVAAAAAVDLNGLMVVATSGGGSERSAQVLSLDCETAQPGTYVVISGTRDPSGNGMLVPDVVAEVLDLFSAGGAVSILVGSVLIDGAPLVEAGEGRSVALDAPVPLRPDANDDGGDWCFGDLLYDTVNSGTPGAPNPGCSVAQCLDGGNRRATVRPGPGDLLITELLGDPRGSDIDNEWVEVMVTAQAPVDLNGLIIRKSSIAMALDASCVSAQPGETLTIAASTDALQSADIVAPRLLMSSSEGSVELRRGSVLIDAAAVPRAAPQRALALDSFVTTDAGNDDAGHWCYADETYDTSGNAGSPGGVNPGCGVSRCGAGSGRPGQGDLLITEVFSNPSGVEENKEWIEVLVTAAGPVDLDGLILSKSSSVAMALGSGCTTARPGDVVVLGASTDSLLNGNVDVAIEAAGWSSSSAAGTIQLHRGDVLVDAATVPQSLDGVSLSLDPARQAWEDNDDAGAFCKSRATGVFDEHGTPGLANELCTSGCSEGARIRDPLHPSFGDLVITEVYANPTSTDDARDWLEVYVAGAANVELNGVRIEVQGTGSPVGWTLDSLDCLTVAPGSYAVIGGVNVAADGVAADATFGEEGDSLLLGTVRAHLALLTVGPAADTLVDEVDYTPPSSGVSTSLDPSILDAVGNDAGARWCAAPAGHLPFVGTGSPGEANDACP